MVPFIVTPDMTPSFKTDHRYEHVPGFFHQDVLAPIISAEASLEKHFGLLDETPERWSTLKKKIQDLNDNAEKGVVYKLLWFGRHGQGFHNIAEVKYEAEGTWGHWGKQNTDGNLVWGPDPYLTEIGQGQARALSKAWVVESKHGIPLPTVWFASPLRRTLRTCLLSWEGIWEQQGKGPEGKGVGIRALELIREVCGMNTCDKRRPTAEIKAEFPNVVYPEDMDEQDERFMPEEHESPQSCFDRVSLAFDEIWKEDDTYVSLTAHAGIMRVAFAVLNHPMCPIVTGEMVPMVVKRVPI